MQCVFPKITVINIMYSYILYCFSHYFSILASYIYIWVQSWLLLSHNTTFNLMDRSSNKGMSTSKQCTSIIIYPEIWKSVKYMIKTYFIALYLNNVLRFSLSSLTAPLVIRQAIVFEHSCKNVQVCDFSVLKVTKIIHLRPL